MISILVLMKMSNKKVYEKIVPLANSAYIDKIYVIRNKNVDFNNKKIKVIYPPKQIQNILFLVELYRLILALYILVFRKIDAIISVYFFLNGIYAYFLSKLFRKKKIHNLVGEDLFMVIKNNMAINILKNSDYIITRGENTKKIIECYDIDTGKLAHPPNLYNFKTIKYIKKEYDFIFIGNFVQKKRIDDCLKAIKKVVESNTKYFKFAFVGDGPLFNDIIELSEELNLSDYCEFLGYRNDVDVLLQKSKTLVLVSEKEGLPMVMVEAMSFGLPVIITDNADVTTIAKHNYNSLVVEIGDIETIAKYMEIILGDEELYNMLSKNALKIREKEYEYSMEGIAEEWDKIFKKMELI